jgi:Helix-turn-helix domain
MHTAARIDEVLRLADQGRTATEVARIVGLSRSTVRDWMGGAVPQTVAQGPDCSPGACPRCSGSGHDFSRLPREYLYLLGLYLGDGCISAHPRGVFRLRFFLDACYPAIVAECEAAIRILRPHNKISRAARCGGYANSRQGSNIEVSSYSRSWPCLIPQHGPGRKHERPIALAGWQQELLEQDPRPLLRGLMHSDGCRFINTGTNWRHPRYSFSNASTDIRQIFCDACDALGLRWTTAPRTVYVSRKKDVAALDEFIGPKA